MAAAKTDDEELFDPTDVTGDEEEAAADKDKAAKDEDEAAELEEDAAADKDAGKGENKDADIIKKLRDALQSKNIVIPDAKEKDLKEFASHLLTALATSEAHVNADEEEEAGADMTGGAGADQGAGGAPGGGAQPEQYAMMSRQINALKREVEAERKQKITYLSRLATISSERLTQKLKTIVKADLMDEAEKKEHENALKAKLLSVASGDDAGTVERVKLIDHLYKRSCRKLKTDELLNEQVDLSLSANAKPVPPPENLWKKEIDDKGSDEAADEILGRRK